MKTRVLTTLSIALFFTLGAGITESFAQNCSDVSCFNLPGCRQKSSWMDGIELYGWAQGGVYANTRGATTQRDHWDNYRGKEKSYLVEDSGNSQLLSTVHTTDFQLNQLWGGVKKVADGSNGLDWGFGAELFYGTEAWFAQSYGDASFDYGWQDGDYYLAIPELYVQLAYGDFSVKLGKFETMVGYESMRAPDCFFYSHSHIFMMEPYSHTGAYFEYDPCDHLNIGLGYIQGADNGFENKYDDHGFLGYISYQFTPKLNLSYSIHATKYGIEDHYIYSNPGEPRGFGGCDLYFHTVVAEYDITDKFSYALQWNYGDAKDRNSGDHYRMYGVSNYFIYQINNCWGIGTRLEWAKDNENGYVGFLRNGGEVFGATLGLNWTPCNKISIRPEIRYDRTTNGNYVFNYGNSRDQVSGGCCIVYTF